MALLHCICCCRHRLRTAVCWDSPDESSPRFLTYSCLVERVTDICRTLRSSYFIPTADHAASQEHRQPSPVAIHGRNCPEVLCALLGVMAVPAPFMPLDLGRPAASRWSTLHNCGVCVVLIELSLFNDFLSECKSQPSNCRIRFDDRLLQLELVICLIQWPHLPQSHDSHVSHGFIKDHIAEEFHAALKHYHQEINTDCWLCSFEHSSTSTSISIESEYPDTCTKEELHVKSSCLTNSLLDSLDDCTNSFPSLHPASIAYLLHTTGTTGQPKLVRVPHCCVVPNVVDLRGRFVMSPDDVVFNAAPLTFDPSIVEIFLALSSGSCLLLVPTKVKKSPRLLTRVLFQRQFATVLQVTPALVRQLPEEVITSRLLGSDSCVRVLAFGGEACPTLDTLAQWKSPKNKTTIFNIYGITEVSSWATCYQVTADDLVSDDSPSSVPLGSPLLGTQIELRNGDGTPVSSGNGFIWIGGSYRACLLGDERRLIPGVMRPSGDLGHIDKNSRLLYDGRCDRQVKRLGHRVNLDYIQQRIEGLEVVTSCAVLVLAQQNLLFQLVAFVVLAEISIKNDVETKSLLFTEMKEVLPNYCIPDHIEILEQLPVNEHGKIDIAELRQFYDSTSQTTASTSEADWTSLTIESAGVLLKSCAQRLLGLQMWSDQQNILELGVSSFDVVRFANHIEDELKKFAKPSSGKTDIDTTKLVEYLLEQPLSQVAAYVCSTFSNEPKLDSNVQGSSDGNVKKEGAYASTASVQLQKRAHFGLSDELLPKKVPRVEYEDKMDISRVMVSLRRGQSFINGRLQDNVICHQFEFPLPIDQNKLKCSFELKWKVDTGKCVDASPLLVLDKSRSHDPSEIVYIGSHSGRFFAICFQTGRVLWETRLTDRIESSACLSVCGQFVIIGCYDGCVYSLSCDSGSTHWCIRPGGSLEPIKSSPCVDSVTGLVWIGSHDHHIYALDIYVKKVVHRVFPGGGSCFSSPCVDCVRRLLYCATLQGIIASINLDSGCILWTYKCPKPIFSSPTILPSRDYIVVGCVDGGVYVIGSNGQHVSTLSTADAIFSSCCVVQDSDSETRVYCGSHDKQVYCWSEELQLEWKSQTLDSEIYSIPCVSQVQFKTAHVQGTCQKPMLFASTTSGCVYTLNPESGQVIGKLALPWDVFSSPVVYDNCIAIGCRDDYVYCYMYQL